MVLSALEQALDESTVGLNKRLIMETPVANVFTVDGGFVRNRCDVDFIGGGHQLVYKWMPRGEAWVENLGGDGKFIAAHELSEIFDMLTKGWSYEKAHAKANQVEKAARRAWRHNESAWGIIEAIQRLQPGCCNVIAEVICSWPRSRVA